jgi:hypothetical protein
VIISALVLGQVLSLTIRTCGSSVFWQRSWPLLQGGHTGEIKPGVHKTDFDFLS